MRPSFLLLLLALGCPVATSDSGKDSDEPVDVDGDGHTADEDCDESDGTTYVGAPELCDGVDNDCDGTADDDATDATTWYADEDGDGYGDPGQPQGACTQPTGFVAEAGDCDDADAAWNPGAPEEDCTDPNDYNCDGSVGFQDGDGDGTAACEDCDDADPDVHPGAPELCNDADDDCDGQTDEDATDATTWYQDDDRDGFGTDVTALACTQPEGFAQYTGDCDDTTNDYHPGAAETDCTDPNDYNCDGSTGYDDADGDGRAACEECDDSDATHYPGADEYCDGVDDDCDGEIDEPDALDAGTWYADADGDGYGDLATPQVACDLPADYTADASDCDDSDASEYPGATEVCDGDDDNCDGAVDEASAVDASVWYADADSDSYGDATISEIACSAPAGYVPDATDCDDTDELEFPGATEMCDGDDDNCDGFVDEATAADAATWYSDSDGDGFGDAAVSTVACSAPGAFVADATDCDDADTAVNPAAVEACNGLDDNCDGDVDEATASDAQSWYADSDGDGFGDASIVQVACEVPAGYSALSTDCDDGDVTEYPGAAERCDGDDDDCDGEADEDGAVDVATWYRDADGDTYGDAASSDVDCDQPAGFVADATDCDDAAAGTNPGETEVCDDANVDEDCSGAADDADAAATGQTAWYADGDGDTYGDAALTISRCDQPSGHVADATDCDDADAGDHPGATETVGNSDDEDCDGGEVCYVDADADGYRTLTGSTVVSGDTDCADAGEGASADPATDCDDGDATENPAAAERCDGDDDDCDGDVDEDSAVDAATWYRDADTDGYGDVSLSDVACDQPSGFVADATDCDDTDIDTNPGEIEVCDAANVDEDCDGDADDDDSAASGTSTWYADGDSDSYGAPAVSTSACDQPTGYVAVAGDCDDGAADVNPGEAEVCDSADTDEDCSGDADDDDASATGQTSWYADADTDSYGSTTVGVSACDAPATYVADSSDCDDGASAVHPGATEGVADGLDQDCDDLELCFHDDDGDGELDSSGDTVASTDLDCADLYEADATASTADCDDTDAARFSTNPEICDSVDNDCDTVVDDGASATWYGDLDEDGYGDPAETTSACTQPSGYVSNSDDCDDTEALAWTGAVEACDEVDNDCDGSVDEDVTSTFYGDLDEDGYGDPAETITECSAPVGYVSDATDCDDLDDTVNPGATEVCDDGIDQNCAIDCREESVVAGSGLTTFTGVNGSTATSSFGSKLVGGVDVNGDGLEDFLVGDRLYDTGVSNIGRVTVFLGTGSGFTDTVSNPTATITGADSAARFGQGLAAGDLDGDGIDDIIAGTAAVNGFGGGSTALTDNGRASVFLGPFERTAGATTALSTTAADCTVEAVTARTYLGTSVAYGGDLTGDGTADWVYGAHQAYTGYLQGYVGIVNTGSCSATLNTSASIHTIAGSAGDVFGHSVLGDVDLDGDGVDDLLVSGAAADAVYVFLGPVTATSRTGADASVTGMDFYYSTSAAEDNYGDRLGVAGDTDLDGYVEFLVGASSYDVGTNTSAGAAFLIPGVSALAAGSDTGPNLAAVQVLGSSTTFNVGAGVSGAGDVDADGAPDFLVGFAADTPSATAYGAAALFYGGASGVYSPTLSSTPSGYAMVNLETTTTGSNGTGGQTAPLGDVDADGFDDFMLANMNYAPSATRFGRTYLVYGSGE